jgi:hypothetical protein
MNTIAFKQGMCVLATTATAIALGYGLARVRADGAPTTQPLWYSGTVANAQGTPLEDYHQVTLRLFESDHAPMQGGETAVCMVDAKDTRMMSGHFRVDASSCAAALQKHPDLFVELTVDSGTPFDRAKIGAVPFALEAQHAVTASEARGALAAQIVPAGMIAMFAGTCPAGWVEYLAMRGRVPRGEPTGSVASLDAAGSDNAVVVAHTHAVTGTASASGDHAHSVSGSTSADGNHTHQVQPGVGFGAGSSNPALGRTQDGWNSPAVMWIGSADPAGTHTHTLTGTAANAGQHTHALAVTAAAAGEAGTGKNMQAYREVIFCIKQ